MNKKVAVVILNYRNYQDTIECLRSLFEVSYSDIELVVVDNDSQNGSLAYICDFILLSERSCVTIKDGEIEKSGLINENIILLQSSKNGGYAAGNNLGIRIAIERNADYVLILNNDTLVDKYFLEPMIDFAESDENIGAVGPKVVDENGRFDRSCARRRPTLLSYFITTGIGGLLFNKLGSVGDYYGLFANVFNDPKEVDILSGSCMLFKSNVFLKIGLFDEYTFLYLEEFIVHEKLRDYNLKSFIVPESLVIHKKARSTSSVNSVFIEKENKKSRKYYLLEYRGYNSFVVFLIMSSYDAAKYIVSLFKRLTCFLRF